MTLTPSSSRPAQGSELDYAQVTTAVLVDNTAEATPDDLVALPARTFDGSTIITVEFFCASVVFAAATAATAIVNLWDDTTDLGRLAVFQQGLQTTNPLATPMFCARRLTPAAGAHTYSIKAWRVNANFTADGSAPRLPMYIRSVRVSA